MANVSAKTRLKILSIVAVCSSFLACISLIIALATDHWQDIQVDRAGLLKIVQYKPDLQQPLSTNVLYFDRHRGLFRYCRAVLRRTKIISKSNCLRDLAFERSPVLDLSHVETPAELQSLMSDLKIRNILVITTTVLMTMADVGVLFAAIIGLVAISINQRTIYTAAMTFAFLATVFAGSSMAIFHGLDFLERTKLNVYMFPAVIRQNKSYNELKSYTDIRQGYSYYFGWFGVFLCGLSAILYLDVRKTLIEKVLRPHPGNTSSSSGSLFSGNSASEKTRKSSKSTIGSLPSTLNNAYDMMESSTNTDMSEVDSSRTPSSDDWNPYNELPHDYD